MNHGCLSLQVLSLDQPVRCLACLRGHLWCLCRANIALVCPRWHRVLHATPSLWSEYYLSAPGQLEDPWSVEDQEEWLHAKLRQLRRVRPAVESLSVTDTAGVDVMSDVLHSVAASRLTRIEKSSYTVPLTAAAMRALAGLTRLQDVAMRGAMPANLSWAVGRLTALRSLELESSQLPAGLPAPLARLPHLTGLALRSDEPLPDVQPLSSLSQLLELDLDEARASTGLVVLPAAHFPRLASASFRSPHLKVRARVQLAHWITAL